MCLAFLEKEQNRLECGTISLQLLLFSNCYTFQREQQYLKEENDRLKNDKKQSAHGERILKASGNLSARTNENNEELVAKLKEDVRLQEEKVQELESELVNLKKSRNSHSDRSLVPKPPVTSNRKNEKGSRRPYSSSRYVLYISTLV